MLTEIQNRKSSFEIDYALTPEQAKKACQWLDSFLMIDPDKGRFGYKKTPVSTIFISPVELTEEEERNAFCFVRGFVSCTKQQLSETGSLKEKIQRKIGELVRVSSDGNRSYTVWYCFDDEGKQYEFVHYVEAVQFVERFSAYLS
jgi:hypothetical protein